MFLLIVITWSLAEKTGPALGAASKPNTGVSCPFLLVCFNQSLALSTIPFWSQIPAGNFGELFGIPGLLLCCAMEGKAWKHAGHSYASCWREVEGKIVIRVTEMLSP